MEMRRLRLHHPVTFSVWYSLKTFPWQYVFLITASIAFLCKRNSNLYNLPPVQQHLGFSQHLLSTNSAVMHVSHTYLHTYLRVYLQDQFLKEELLSQWIHAFLNLIDTVKLPSKGVVRIHSPSKQSVSISLWLYHNGVLSNLFSLQIR